MPEKIVSAVASVLFMCTGLVVALLGGLSYLVVRCVPMGRGDRTACVVASVVVLVMGWLLIVTHEWLGRTWASAACLPGDSPAGRIAGKSEE